MLLILLFAWFAWVIWEFFEEWWDDYKWQRKLRKRRLSNG